MKTKPKGWSVFWRKDRERWALEYLGPDGVYRQKAVDPSIGVRQKNDAIAWAKAFMGEQAGQVEAGMSIRRRGTHGTSTVEDLYPRWITLREKLIHRDDDLALAPSTVAGHRTHFANHILPMLGKAIVSDIDVLAARKWVRELRDRVKSVSSARNIHFSMAAFMDGVIGEGWVRLASNPFKAQAVRQELPSQVRTNLLEEIVRLPQDWVKALVTSPVVPAPRRVRYAVAFTSGLADGELSGLMWSDIDLTGEVPTLTVRRACALIGKARKDSKSGHASIQRTKTAQRVRVIPLHPASRAALIEWKGMWFPFVGHKPGESDPVFPGPSGGFSRVKSAKHIRNDLKACGLPTEINKKPIDFHATRRTFATALELVDVSESIRQRLMGHARSGVTQRHYTGTELAKLAESIAKLDLTWVPIKPDLGTEIPSEPPSGGSTTVDLDGADGSIVENAPLLRKPLLYPLSYGGEAEKLRAIVTGRKESKSKSERTRKRAIGLSTAIGNGSVPSEGLPASGSTTETIPFSTILDEALSLDFDQLIKAVCEVMAVVEKATEEPSPTCALPGVG